MLDRIGITGDGVLIRNVRVLDVRKGVLREPANVLVSGAILKNLNAAEAPAGWGEIDGCGHTMIPGLINCHSHILSPFVSEQKGFLGAWAIRQMHRNLEATLAAGVVCVRDMLSPIKVMNMVRGKISSGKLIGPEIVAAGAVLSCRDGYPEFITPLPFPLSAIIGQPKLNLHSPKKAEAMVRYLHRCGAEVAKIGYTSFSREFYDQQRMPTITRDVFKAICDTAHELGMTVSVHHNWSEDLNTILRADIDSLEHLIFDREITEGEVQAIKTQGIKVVPTLTVTDSMARFEEKLGFLQSDRAKEMFEERARQHLLFIASTWLDFKDESYHASFGHWRANRRNYAWVENSARILHEGGVQMLAGTDLGAVVAFPGELADEIKRLHHIGMSKLDAIRSATLDAARLVNRENRLGSVEPGKLANVALVEGNPLEDLDALRRVRLVGKNGEWFRPKHQELPDFWPGFSPLFEPPGKDWKLPVHK